MDGRMSRGIELLRKLSEIKVVATDVDGTLTHDRKSFKIPLEVIQFIRELRSNGVRVVLVSANGFPILVGLARYIGIDGVVAENGCIIADLGLEQTRFETIHLANKGTRDLARIILNEYKDVLQETWQNDYRKFDFALITKGKKEITPELIRGIEKIIESNGYTGKVRISSSGYAIHITPMECSKLRGLKTLLSLMDIDIGNVLGIGDSAMDVEFVEAAGISVAVGNADEELKEKADIITDLPSGYGFAELARTIIDARKVDFQSMERL